MHTNFQNTGINLCSKKKCLVKFWWNSSKPICWNDLEHVVDSSETHFPEFHSLENCSPEFPLKKISGEWNTGKWVSVECYWIVVLKNQHDCFWVSKLVKSLFQPFIGSSVTYLHVFFSFWWVGILIMMFWSIRPYRNIEVLTNRSNVHWSKRALSLAPCARTCRGATCAITKGTNRPRLGVIASVRIHERTHYLVPVGLDGFALFQWVSVYFFKINITLKINHQFPGVGFSVKFPKFPTSVILPKAQHRSR